MSDNPHRRRRAADRREDAHLCALEALALWLIGVAMGGVFAGWLT